MIGFRIGNVEGRQALLLPFFDSWSLFRWAVVDGAVDHWGGNEEAILRAIAGGGAGDGLILSSSMSTISV